MVAFIPSLWSGGHAGIAAPRGVPAQLIPQAFETADIKAHPKRKVHLQSTWTPLAVVQWPFLSAPVDGFRGFVFKQPKLQTVILMERTDQNRLLLLWVKASSRGDGIYLAPQAPSFPPSIHPSMHWLIYPGFYRHPSPSRRFPAPPEAFSRWYM